MTLEQALKIIEIYETYLRRIEKRYKTTDVGLMATTALEKAKEVAE